MTNNEEEELEFSITDEVLIEPREPRAPRVESRPDLPATSYGRGMRIVYEVADEDGERIMRAHAPIRGITIPTNASHTTKDLTPGWYLATLERGCLSLDCASFSTKLTRQYAMEQIGGDPYE
jgi:hypothetical protein